MPDDVFRWVIAAAVILAALSFVVQAGVALALYRVMKNTQSKVTPLAERVGPILTITHQILEENKSKIAEVSTQVAEIARNARAQTERIGELLAEGTDRAKVRMEQIDKTVDQTVEQVEQVGDAVKTAVMKPVREVNALLAGLKAAIATLATGNRRPSVDHATQDEEMFI